MSHFITGRKYVHFIYWSKKCPLIICPSKKRPGAVLTVKGSCQHEFSGPWLGGVVVVGAKQSFRPNSDTDVPPSPFLPVSMED